MTNTQDELNFYYFNYTISRGYFLVVHCAFHSHFNWQQPEWCLKCPPTVNFLSKNTAQLRNSFDINSKHNERASPLWLPSQTPPTRSGSAAAAAARTTTTIRHNGLSAAKQCSASLINATTGQQKDHLNAWQAARPVRQLVLLLLQSQSVPHSFIQSVSQSVSQWASLGVYLHVCVHVWCHVLSCGFGLHLKPFRRTAGRGGRIVGGRPCLAFILV